VPAAAAGDGAAPVTASEIGGKKIIQITHAASATFMLAISYVDRMFLVLFVVWNVRLCGDVYIEKLRNVLIHK
jgi:hypothetical protein